MNKLEVLSLIFTALAYVYYVRAILKSVTRPTVSSWISWLMMDMAIFAAMLTEGIFSVQMATFVGGSIVVLIVCLFKKASVGWRMLDTICVAIVVAAVSLWALSGSATIAILMSLVAAIVGSIPMLVNTWQNPENETMAPWMTVFVGTIFALCALDSWTLVSSSAGFTFAALQLSFMALIVRKYTFRTARA